MIRGGSSDQRAEHKEERVWAREGHGEDEAAETLKGRLLERQGKHLTENSDRFCGNAP